MKKLTSILTSTALFVSMFSIASGEETLKYDTSKGYYFEYSAYSDGVKIERCRFDGGTEVVVPKEIDGKKVLSVSSDFMDDGFTSLVIEADIKELPEYAVFFDATIESVVLNDGLKKLGTDCFSECSALKSVTLPDSLEEIGSGSFDDCPNLNNVNIPDNVDIIGYCAFQRCSSLNNLNWDMTASECGVNFAAETPWLKDYAKTNEWLAINNGDYLVRYIGNGSTLTVPKASKINDGVCARNTSIKEVVSEGNLPDSMFYGCTSLEKAVIKSGTLGNTVFGECTALSEVEFNPSMDYIPPNTFQGCTSLKEFNFPSNITAIGSSAFMKSGLVNVTVPDNITVINDRVFFMCPNLESIHFPETLTDLGNSAVSGSEKLKSANVPQSVANKISNVFNGCTSLTNLEYKELTTAIYSSANNTPWRNTIDANNKEEFFILDGELKSYNGTSKNPVIPDTVKVIGSRAFTSKDIESVTIPSSVETIQDGAFYLTNLKEVTIPATVKSIGSMAFGECTELESLTISGNCTVGSKAFYNCVKLTDKNIDSTVKLSSDAFEIQETSTSKPTAEPTVKPTTEPTAAPTDEPQKTISVTTTNGEIEVKAEEKRVEFTDVKPFVDEANRTQMPIRVLAEMLGFDVDWNDTTKTATLRNDENTITVKIGENTINKNSETITMDTTARVINDRTYIPLRAISEALGYVVEWK